MACFNLLMLHYRWSAASVLLAALLLFLEPNPTLLGLYNSNGSIVVVQGKKYVEPKQCPFLANGLKWKSTGIDKSRNLNGQREIFTKRQKKRTVCAVELVGGNFDDQKHEERKTFGKMIIELLKREDVMVTFETGFLNSYMSHIKYTDIIVQHYLQTWHCSSTKRKGSVAPGPSDYTGRFSLLLSNRNNQYGSTIKDFNLNIMVPPFPYQEATEVKNLLEQGSNLEKKTQVHKSIKPIPEVVNLKVFRNETYFALMENENFVVTLLDYLQDLKSVFDSITEMWMDPIRFDNIEVGEQLVAKKFVKLKSDKYWTGNSHDISNGEFYEMLPYAFDISFDNDTSVRMLVSHSTDSAETVALFSRRRSAILVTMKFGIKDFTLTFVKTSGTTMSFQLLGMDKTINIRKLPDKSLTAKITSVLKSWKVSFNDKRIPRIFKAMNRNEDVYLRPHTTSKKLLEKQTYVRLVPITTIQIDHDVMIFSIGKVASTALYASDMKLVVTRNRSFMHRIRHPFKPKISQHDISPTLQGKTIPATILSKRVEMGVEASGHVVIYIGGVFAFRDGNVKAFTSSLEN